LKFDIMVKRERLYDAFGDLVYAIAKVDGAVQPVEIDTLNRLLADFSGKYEINYTFNYDLAKEISVEDAYNHAIEVCKENGPDPEYAVLLEMMVEVAKAYMGIVPSERELLDKFIDDLKEKFINEIS